MSGGRQAALPGPGYQLPPRRDQRGENPFLVVVHPERYGRVARFDFAVLPLSETMRGWLIEGFIAATGPSGSCRGVASAQAMWRAVRSFAHYLASLDSPADSPSQLRAAQWDGWVLSVPIASRRSVVGSMRSLLRHVRGLSDEFRARMQRTRTGGGERGKLSSYTEAEFTRIITAAKTDVRACVRRLREGREVLAAWRDGRIDRTQDRLRWDRGWLLDHIDRHGMVPKYRDGRQHNKVAEHGGSPGLYAQLFPTHQDLAAAAVLLICLTGHNLSAVLSLTVAHHRPDGDAGGPRTALAEMLKPRRGRSRAHMTVALTDAGAGTGERIEVSTPFGVYGLVHEMCAPVRERLGTDQLFCYYTHMKGKLFRPGLRLPSIGEWSRIKQLPSDSDEHDAEQPPLVVDARRLRMTWLALHQQPVAHTDQTLVNDYLARNRGDIAEYQKIVAATLDEQVSAARRQAVMHTLTAEQVDRARTDPEAVAAEIGVSQTVLTDLLKGHLDTVMAGCIDHHHSPHAPAGQPCTASFLMCLSCPCARATPAHLPVIVAVHDRLHDKAREMTPLRWAQRFAGPAAQLADILDRYPPVSVAAARSATTTEQHDLVERLLARSLDLA